MMRMTMLGRWAFVALALATTAGCPTIAPPGYLHPGTAAYQQNQAQRFDPYPLPDVGPETNARPLAFIRPAPENERMQNVDAYVKHYGGALPPAGVYRAPRTGLKKDNIVPVPTPETAPPFVPPPGSPPVFVPGPTSSAPPPTTTPPPLTPPPLTPPPASSPYDPQLVPRS